MPLTSTPDITSLPSDVMRLVEHSPNLITDIIQDGFQSLDRDFTVVETEDEAYLYSLTALDVARPASDDFVAKPASKMGFRKAKLQDVDYDFVIPRSEVLRIAKSYVRKFAGVDSVEDALKNPVELMFLQEVMKAQGSFMRRAAWKGSRNEAGTGAAASVDGFLVKMALGTAAGGDIEATHVQAPAAALSETNTYDHVQAICKKIVATKEDLLDYELEMTLSRTVKMMYDANRRAKFPNSVGPNEAAEHPDDFPMIKFKVDSGLSGKDFISVSPKNNLLFGTDSNTSVNKLTIIPDVKVWKINVFYRAFFDYAYGNFVFHNNKF